MQLVCCLAACNNTESIPEETQPEDTAPFEFTVDSLSKFTVVYSDAKDMKRAALSVASLFQDYTGIKPAVKADTEEETEYEVLVGLTNRAETQEFYSNVDAYDTGYALIGTKLIIVGVNRSAAIDSVSLFRNEVLRKSDENSILLADGDSSIVKDVLRNGLHNWSDEDLSVLSGLTVNALGDSYFAGDGIEKGEVWLSLLGSKYNMSMNNYGKGGSTVSNKVTTNSPMCERYTSMSNNNADIILLEGGRNDFNKDVAIGETDSYDTTTFSGALNVTIEGLKEKYPNAMIVCISNWNFPDEKFGRVYSDYAGAMEAVAERQGVRAFTIFPPAIPPFRE